VDWLDVSIIKDTRTGRHARIPKVRNIGYTLSMWRSIHYWAYDRRTSDTGRTTSVRLH